MTEEERRKKFIGDLRALANFLEQTEVPHPIFNVLGVYVADRAELTQIAKVGRWEKEYVGDWFMLKKTFGEDLTLQYQTEREKVCRRVVTGKRVIPAQEQREVDVIEWVCDDASLLATREG